MAANVSLVNAPRPLDVESVRGDFPILATTVHGRPLTYLDSAASSQRALPKPIRMSGSPQPVNCSMPLMGR